MIYEGKIWSQLFKAIIIVAVMVFITYWAIFGIEKLLHYLVGISTANAHGAEVWYPDNNPIPRQAPDATSTVVRLVDTDWLIYALGTSTASSTIGTLNLVGSGGLGIGRTSTTTIRGNGATSTFSNGINLPAGCFSINGVCVGTSGTGITSLNGLTGSTQTFVNDTNVTISSAGTEHTLGWSGLFGLTRGGLNRDFTGQAGVITVSGGAFFASTSPLTVGYLVGTTTNTSSLAGLLSVTGAGTSTFTNGLSAGGLSSSNGITLTGGSLLLNNVLITQLTTTATSSLSGAISTSGLSSSNGITISGGGANFPAGSISNTELENSSLTVTAGTGLTTGGAVSLGGSVTLNLSTPVSIANGGTNNTAFSPGMVIVSGASSLNATSSLLTVGQLNATTTATSTFAGGVYVITLNASSASATSTFSNGIQLAGGCFRDINGTCLTAGGAGTPGGSDGQIQYNNSSVFGGATFFFLDDTNNRIGIATTTPNLSFTMGSSTPAYNPEVIEPWRTTVTVNLNNGNHFKVILAGATTLTLSNGWAGQTADITICQDTTGGRTITAYTNPILWPGATTTLSEGVNKCNLLGILVSSGTSTKTYNVTGLITGY